MDLRPEFEILHEYFVRLRRGTDLDQSFMKMVRATIEWCERVAHTEDEKLVVRWATYWWRKRATNFGLGMPIEDTVSVGGGGQKLLPAPPKKFELSPNDRRFLRSLRIAADKEEDEDDGA